MGNDVEPIPGNWYISRGDGRYFQVVGLDGDDSDIEIQLDDGIRDTIPGREWGRLEIELAAGELNVEAPTNDVSDGPSEDLSDDPHALRLPSEQESYRRENVEYAGKVGAGFPDPRPEHGPDRGPERGSEMGIEQWPETREDE